MKFKEFINENVQGINDAGIGSIITFTIQMIAQIHIWHLLCPSGQKHTALGELYTELQDEVDSLAERFLAQGGNLELLYKLDLIVNYDDFTVLEKLNEFRSILSARIDTRPEMASIADGIIDLQEVIDNKIYKFKLA